VKQSDFILYEFQRRAQQKREENMLKKIKSAEPVNSTPFKEKHKLNKFYNTTSQVVM